MTEGVTDKILICDPLCHGQVYAHTTGTTAEWYDDDRTLEWIQVAPGDQLRPGTHEPEPMDPAPISRKLVLAPTIHLPPSQESNFNSTTFRNCIMQRDAQCVASGQPIEIGLVASPGAEAHWHRRCSRGRGEICGEQTSDPEVGIHGFDARIGILRVSIWMQEWIASRLVSTMSW